jgi:hypothetical protein
LADVYLLIGHGGPFLQEECRFFFARPHLSLLWISKRYHCYSYNPTMLASSDEFRMNG